MSHARLSPSARHRWGACPASVRECAKFPDDVAGPAAIDGTHSHTLLEWCVKNNAAAASQIGVTMKDDDGEFKVDADRAERVQFALDYIQRRMEQIPNCKVISEEKVNPVTLLGRDDLKGTIDIQLVGDDYLELIDYKDGMGVVEAEKNPQLEVYAWGVLAKHTICGITPFQRMRMTIIQPKLRSKGLDGWVAHEVNVAEFMVETGKQIIAEAAATDAPDAPFVPGESQCKYCRAKGSCSALANQAMEASGISFENLDVAKQAADKEPETMSNQQIREILEAAPLIRQMLEGVEKEALRRFEAGQNIDGLKVVRGRGTRAWAFDDEQMAEKLKKFGLPKDAIWQAKLISPAQAEKLTWEKRSGEKVQLTERQLARMKDEYIKKSDGKLTVVSLSDDRPEVTMSAAQMFSAVTPEPSLPSFLLSL